MLAEGRKVPTRYLSLTHGVCAVQEDSNQLDSKHQQLMRRTRQKG